MSESKIEEIALEEKKPSVEINGSGEDAAGTPANGNGGASQVLQTTLFWPL